MMEGTGMEKQKYAAIVLAAGSGKRMNSQVHKQYLIIQDRPVLYYSLKAFEDSAVDEIVLVVGKSVAISGDIPKELEDDAVEARDACPVSAIDID